MSAALAEKAFDEEVGTALDEEDSLPPTQEEGKSPEIALKDRKEEARKAREIRLSKMPNVPEPPQHSKSQPQSSRLEASLPSPARDFASERT